MFKIFMNIDKVHELILYDLYMQVYRWITSIDKSEETEKKMRGESSGLIIGLSVGVVIGVALAIAAFFCFKYHRKQNQIGNSSSRRAVTVPIRKNGADASTILSDSSLGTESPRSSIQNGMTFWLGGLKKAHLVSASGIMEYSYKYVFLFFLFSTFPFWWMLLQ